MTMPLEDLHTLPRLLPVPQLNCHVITCSEAEGLSRMYSYGTNVVGVGLEAGDLFGGVVIDNPQLKVVRASNNPVLACNKTASTDGHIGEFKGLDGGSRFVRPDVNVAAVKRGKDPWLFAQSAQYLGTCWAKT
jgi:hypothetical protein